MEQASKELKFEKAARLRDEIHLLETLDNRGELDEHVQPEVFFIDPKKGLAGLKKVLKLAETPRTIEGVDIAHLGGDETVASLVQFIDGLPFKPGYKRFRIRGVQGIDDFRSIHEVVSRRFARLHDESEVFPTCCSSTAAKGNSTLRWPHSRNWASRRRRCFRSPSAKKSCTYRNKNCR